MYNLEEETCTTSPDTTFKLALITVPIYFSSHHKGILQVTAECVNGY